MKNYPTVSVVAGETAVTDLGECSGLCYNNTDCENWMLRIKVDGSLTCQLRGEKPAGATAETFNEADTWAFFGARSCMMGARIPAMPEFGEELSYKEECQDNQKQVEHKVINDWDIDKCPCTFLLLFDPLGLSPVKTSISEHKTHVTLYLRGNIIIDESVGLAKRITDDCFLVFNIVSFCSTLLHEWRLSKICPMSRLEHYRCPCPRMHLSIGKNQRRWTLY